MSDNLRFTSHVNHQPWFFVPDTGTPGATAVLIEPSGMEVPADETQTGDSATFGPRVGFKVPFRFTEEGEYKLVVTQDDLVTTYEIEVQAARRIVTDPATGKIKVVVGGTEGKPEPIV